MVVLSPHVLFVARGDRTAGSGYTRRIVAADRFTGGSSFRGRRAGDRGLSAATLQRRQAEEYLRVKFRVQDFDRIFLYIVAGVALVGLIGFGVYATAGGSKATPKHAAAAVGLPGPGIPRWSIRARCRRPARCITTLPPVPFPSIPSGEPGRTTVAGSVHHGDRALARPHRRR